ncbi:hypothetical protein K470DRAFT_273569 [Piedraia hortae CBS 480.64]|uniref:Uncharacterized protein n=1 Tax=Piedraia hortae CBS 480.64 TaxID=1314780 RepID=A0A6A7BQP6_9PEZI|nr:hypothetical protein K470DRAFT_273569 [Piedraia hortae CBS 480.64]
MLEKRVLQELRYVGLLSTGEVPHYELHEDDELSARLRTLQHELRNVSRINHVRKARVRELVEERMAMQEYNQVADDLDNQVIEAYVKRNRSQGKPAKKTTSLASRGVVQKGVATSSAVKEGMESIRTVVAKRKNWHEMLGPAVNYGRPDLPDEFTNIFDDESMKRLERAEAEAVAAETED